MKTGLSKPLKTGLSKPLVSGFLFSGSSKPLETGLSNPLKTGSSKPLESGFIIFSLCSLHERDCYIPGVRVVLLCGEHFACFVKILKLQKQLF